ncbi:MAG: molybdenum cofactor guanylyltransferase MobA [Burkholderiaceae bacterium]|nr:molybdenum cofactor guanylyltransferase MobA [Burkholderiaceae bacterium]
MRPTAPLDHPAITALLLAGGQGARMGGRDKGLQLFAGVPLAQHALARLARQTLPPTATLISANRHLADYRAFGVPVCADTVTGFAGPLAGFLTGLQQAFTPLLLTLPCDTPRFPLSLCERLAQVLESSQADIAMACGLDDEQRLQPQPAFCLLRVQPRLRDDLAHFLAEGGRKISAWTARHSPVTVPFDTPGDDPRAFANANTLEQLHALERFN